MTTKQKQQTLRQQMRAQAELDLDKLVKDVEKAVAKVVPGYLGQTEILKLLSSSQTKTVREHLVTRMANVAEENLVKLWNDQQTLELGDPK